MIIIVLSFVESEANVAKRVFSFSLIALITTLCVQQSPSTRSPIVPSIFIIYGRERVTMFQLTATSLSLVLILCSLTLHCPSTPVYLFVPFCFHLMVRRDLPTSFLCAVSLLTLYTKIELQSVQLPPTRLSRWSPLLSSSLLSARRRLCTTPSPRYQP